MTIRPDDQDPCYLPGRLPPGGRHRLRPDAVGRGYFGGIARVPRGGVKDNNQ